MKVYLDYEGTVIESGECARANFGCIEVIDKLQRAGHEVVLNTGRVENPAKLKEALDMLNENYWYIQKDRNLDITLKPIPSTEYKHDPGRWDWDEMKAEGVMYIDDYAYGIPLKPCCMARGNMVDWAELDKQFKENGVY